MKKMLLACLIVLATAPLAAGHDLWLEPANNGLLLKYGHGEKLDPCEPEKVKDVKAVDCGGKSLTLKKEKQGKATSLVFPGARPATVTLFFDDGYFVQTTDGWKNGMKKREAEGKYTILQSLKSRMYAKAILDSCAKSSTPVGMPFEIVPEKDPTAMKEGEEFAIRVLKDGKPFEGAGITYREITYKSPKSPKTDKEGRARITIGKPGLHTVNAWIKKPIKDDPDADTLFMTTSVSFVTK